MKKIFIISSFSFLFSFLNLPVNLFSQQNVGIGTAAPHASALLDIAHTSKGLLIPRMTTPGITSVANSAKGLMIYDSLKNQLMVNMGTTIVPNWQTIVFKSGWSLEGNTGTNSTANFIGTTDPAPIKFRINNTKAGFADSGTNNTSFGYRTLESITSGANNTAFGFKTLKNNSTGEFNTAIGGEVLQSNTGGGYNTAIGYDALFSNSNGSENTAIGNNTLYYNTTGGPNTATGAAALFFNTTGSGNTATGLAALYSISSGRHNTATGLYALFLNTTSEYNTATGVYALYYHTTGKFNSAAGKYALYNNTTGFENTAEGIMSLYLNITGIDNTSTGYYSLLNNTTGYYNTSDGMQSLYNNTAGIWNTAMGLNALYHNNGDLAHYNTGIGGQALFNTTNSQYNTAIGYNTGFSQDMGYNNTMLGALSDVNGANYYNCVGIGRATTCTASSQARIGNAATISIGGYAGWTNISDGRYKKNINENVKGLEFIMKLRPVTYHLDIWGISKKLNEGRANEMDEWSKMAIIEKEKIVQSGFVAQEVEQAAKETGYDFSGVDKPKNENDFYGLRYAEFVVPLVKAVQERQQQIEELKKANEQLTREIDELKKTLSSKQ